MKLFLVFSLLFTLFIFSGCQSEKIEVTPTPKKQAKFKREVFDAEKYPGLAAVGKLKIEQSWCAMTLVAEDIVITAGHCFSAEEVDLFKNNTKDFVRLTTVEFKSANGAEIKGLKVEKILKFKIEPDFAIVKLNKKIPKDVITPLEISDMEYAEILRDTEKLGCAGFNGDIELGKRGTRLTISRNINIYHRQSTRSRIDTNCISTHGGSGGLFFEEIYNSETESNDYRLLGVIWGVTGDNFNIKGERVNDRDSITSITPVKVFREDLKRIIAEN